MSDTPVIKIQTTASDELPGGQRPLQTDSLKSTHGFDSANQNSLSFCRGTNVDAGSANLDSKVKPAENNRENATVSGAAVQGRQQERARQVDHKVIEGSNGAGSDYRVHGDWAKASLDKAADNGGPRQPVGQFPLSGPDSRAVSRAELYW
jgi:hypothetical protein